MEVAQISRGIIRVLQESGNFKECLPSVALIEAIALAHDLGHPPFGHGGEVALNYSMREFGGFEGNGQTLRLLSALEAHTDDHGLDLTRRSLLGVLKYPVSYESVVKTRLPTESTSSTLMKGDDWKPPKCYMSTENDLIRWMLTPFSLADIEKFTELSRPPDAYKHGKSSHHTLDTSIMELGDDIAYGVHDFEDGISLGMITYDDWADVTVGIDPHWADPLQIDVKSMGQALFGKSGSSRKEAIGALVNAFIVSIEIEQNDFEHDLLRLNAMLPEVPRKFLDELKKVVVRRVIKTQQVQTLEFRGQQLVMKLFDALASDPDRLLPERYRDRRHRSSDAKGKARVICDYVAGMTDEYATRLYERLYVPRVGQFSDRL